MKVTPRFLVQASESLELLELPRLGKKRQSNPEAGGDHSGYKVPTRYSRGDIHQEAG